MWKKTLVFIPVLVSIVKANYYSHPSSLNSASDEREQRGQIIEYSYEFIPGSLVRTDFQLCLVLQWQRFYTSSPQRHS